MVGEERVSRGPNAVSQVTRRQTAAPSLTLIRGGAVGKSLVFSVKSLVLSVALMMISLRGWTA